MRFLHRGFALAFGAWALAAVGTAQAQENLDQGKSGAQLFASDCAICHKTTAGLSRGRVLGLDSFLREHYTASRESAASIANYIQATDKGPAPVPPVRTKKKDAGKGDDKKPGTGKPDEAKPSDTKPSDKKSSDKKPAEAKPADAKPADAKPADAKPAEPKALESKPAESKPSDGRPADIYTPEKKSESKPPLTPKSD